MSIESKLSADVILRSPENSAEILRIAAGIRKMKEEPDLWVLNHETTPLLQKEYVIGIPTIVMSSWALNYIDSHSDTACSILPAWYKKDPDEARNLTCAFMRAYIEE